MFYEIFGTTLMILVVGGAILFAVAFGFGTVQIHDARLKCFHCGRETPVGRKSCESCGRELQ